MLTNRSILATHANPSEAILIILHNGAHEITGAQPAPGVGTSRKANHGNRQCGNRRNW